MTAPIPTASSDPKRGSRRALLGAGLGALAGAIASGFGRAAPARAANGDTVTVGSKLTGSLTTRITNTNVGPAEAAAFWGDSLHSTGVYGTGETQGVFGNSLGGIGVYGLGQSGIGVRGESTGAYPAVLGQSDHDNTGVLGFSGTGAPPPAKAKTGVYGEATQDGASRGVWGRSSAGNGVYGNSSSGVGVRGISTSAQGVVGVGPIGVEGSSSNQFAWGVGGYNSAAGGTGVWGQANNGYAFRGVGRLRLDSVSGVATIAAGNMSKTVSPGVDVTTGSFVLLTPKVNIGSRALWFTTNATDNKFTIRMSSSRSSGTKVAWLLLG